jgi:DNA-binding CsgD family transcriptional regulator
MAAEWQAENWGALSICYNSDEVKRAVCTSGLQSIQPGYWQQYKEKCRVYLDEVKHMANKTIKNDSEPLASIFFPRFKKFSQDAFSQRMIGFAFSRSWVFIAFSASLIIDQSGRMAVFNSVYTLSLVILVIVLLAGGLLNQRCKILMASGFGRVLPALLSIIGTSFLPFASFNTVFGTISLGVAAVATGTGSGMLLLFWGRLYSEASGPTAAAETSVAFILAALPVPLMLIVPPFVLQLLITAMPIASSIVLFRIYQTEGSGGASGNEMDGCEASGAASDKASAWHLETVGLGWKRVLLKLVISSIAFGIIVSLMHALEPFEIENAFVINSGLSLLLSALIAGSITLAVLFFSKRLDLAFTYRPVIFFMSLGCLLFPFLEDFASIAWIATMSGYLCFEIMNWVTLTDISYRFELPPFRVFGLGRAAVSGGVLLGTLIAQWLNSNIIYNFQIIAAICFAQVFLLIVAYTFTLTERDIAKITRQRTRTPYLEADDKEELSIDDRITLLAEEHGIYGRGEEILRLLVKGRTGVRIEQELYISKGTVNTYLRKLYQRLGVHTRQELIDMFYAVESPDREKPGLAAPEEPDRR